MTFLKTATVLLTATAALLGAEHWDIQYRYRKADSTLTINDLQFPSARRGIACGYITDRSEKDKPIVLLTSDGGEHWTETPVKETGLALYFLDDSTGWMVTDKGIWRTVEAGRAWTKLGRAPSGMLRVWFTDSKHGFTVGLQKRIFETADGGDTWTPLDIVKEIEVPATYTTFGEIAFTGQRGIISGWNIPPRRGGPEWMEPEKARQRQLPHYGVLLQTGDGGQKWTKGEVSMFGQVTRISLGPRQMALGLVSFRDQFEVPSEVMRIDTKSGASVSSFKQKDRAITDVRVFADSDRGIIAGYEPSGPIYNSPIPGKLKILTTDDFNKWTEMTVDYRAVAHSAIIAGPDSKQLWVATDTGMILKLVTD
jgi:hypothetical protein